jgi:hypothetical protein
MDIEENNGCVALADNNHVAPATICGMQQHNDTGGRKAKGPVSHVKPQIQQRCNAELSQAEKCAKRDLKKQLKQQTKLRKYQMRLQQAVERCDDTTAERARRELHDYRQLIASQVMIGQEEEQENEQRDHQDIDEKIQSNSQHESEMHAVSASLSPLKLSPATLVGETERMIQGRAWIAALYEPLIHRCLQKHDQQNQHKQLGSKTDDATLAPCSTTATIPENESTTTTGSTIASTTASATAVAVAVASKRAPPMKQRRNNKDFQTAQAKVLLHHMDKGTQTEGMFQNRDALLGYTRQKFAERAMLVVSSLERLYILPLPCTTDNLLDRLGIAETVCSIGCGPGCDAVGVLAFLDWLRGGEREGRCVPDESQRRQGQIPTRRRQRPLLKSLILMDYVMPQWQDAVVDELANYSLISQTLVEQVFMVSCDVRCSLLNDEANAAALQAIVGTNSTSLTEQGLTAASETSSSVSTFSLVDLVVVSYVLTETRGKWHAFFHDLIAEGWKENDTRKDDDNKNDNSRPANHSPLPLLRSGTLLLMSEPTAWQLHHWLQLVGERLSDYEWLDSSRLSPDLQLLEGRIGPAVLLARVK